MEREDLVQVPFDLRPKGNATEMCREAASQAGEAGGARGEEGLGGAGGRREDSGLEQRPA